MPCCAGTGRTGASSTGDQSDATAQPGLKGRAMEMEILPSAAQTRRGGPICDRPGCGESPLVPLLHLVTNAAVHACMNSTHGCSSWKAYTLSLSLS